MVEINDQLAALAKTQLNAAIKGSEVAVEAAGKLAELQINSAKTAYEDGTRALRQLAAAKEPAQWASLATSAAQPAWDKTATYAKSAHEILVAAQSEFADLVEQHLVEFNKNVAVTLDAALKSAPPGSESAVSAIKSAIQSTSTWYETLVKTAKQAAATTEASFANAAVHVTPARRKAA